MKYKVKAKTNMEMLWYMFLASASGACWWYILIYLAARNKAAWVRNAYWILLMITDTGILFRSDCLV